MATALDDAQKNNSWECDCQSHVLRFRVEPKQRPYEIDLLSITTSAAALDWISQINGKIWGTPKVVGDLVRLLDAVLDLQGNYCSGGLERGPVDVSQLLN